MEIPTVPPPVLDVVNSFDPICCVAGNEDGALFATMSYSNLDER